LADVDNAYEGFRNSDQNASLYEAGYLDQARESRDISRYAYNRGAATLLDLLDAERSYRATQLAYRQSLAAYMVSLEQINFVVGARVIP
jgi:cobalt-zinc-cadmium efflux system outer membrane protein